MQAMLLNQTTNLADNHTPLTLADVPDPTPGDGEILIKVSACGVCHTELDEIEGRLPPPQLPIVLGHQVMWRGMGARMTQHEPIDPLTNPRSLIPHP